MTAALGNAPLRLAGTAVAPQSARLHAHRALIAWHVSTSDIDSVELVVSELVTNAVRHSGIAGDDDVRLSLRLDGAEVLVEAFDTSPMMPRLIVTSEWDECGRGLQLVEALSSGWGTTPVIVGGGQVGKTVFARVPVRIVADAGAET